jgi:outer membrane protein OmpA-like peptidoglycan-associated protein
MQNSTSFLVGLLLSVVCCPAIAQVTVDSRALDHLQTPSTPAAPAPVPPPRAPKATPPAQPAQQPVRPRPNAAATAKPPAPSRTQPTLPPPPPPSPPVVPIAPPPLPVVPPPIVVPVRPAVPPPPATVEADAPDTVKPIEGGVRITFGPGRSDLNPTTAEALRELAHGAPVGSSFAVTAYAPGTPDDPSTPRRLSLSRVLTVRSLLIAEGIASSRIYPKALGSTGPITDGPADRADLLVTRPPPPPAPTSASASSAVPTPAASPAAPRSAP